MSDLATRRTLHDLGERVSSLETRIDAVERRLGAMEPPIVEFTAAGDFLIEPPAKDAALSVTFVAAGNLKAFLEVK